MKKLLSLVLFLCLLLPAAHADEKIYLALGDSITTGYGLSGDEKCFADLIAEKNGYTLINRAVNGATAADVYDLLPRIREQIEKADLITVTCGGNDLLGLLFAQTAAAYNAAAPAAITAAEASAILANPGDPRQGALLYALQSLLTGSGAAPALTDSPAMQEALTAYRWTLLSIIGHIRITNPTAPIIVATQYNPFQSFTGDFALLGHSVDKAVKMLSDAIIANAQIDFFGPTGPGAGYLTADVYTAFAAADDNLLCATMTPFNPDPHPNAHGHKVLFDCFQQVIDSLP